jgi:hypothetical protein
MLEEKNIQSKKYQLGQFFTPVDLVKEILGNIKVDSDIVIEPSFGGCGFIEPMVEMYPDKKIVGIELDKEWYDKGVERFPNLDLYHSNFYDVNNELVFENKSVSFIGNVPFRSPAYSLTTHKKYVKALAHKYEVTGIREEAVFFIIKTADIMITNNYTGGIHYVIPKSLVTNDSKFYLQFKNFLKKYFKIVAVFDVDPSKFDNVAQGLIVLSMQIGGDTSNYNTLHNGVAEPVNEVLQLSSPDIPFQQIFKKTYLGSVPAESFLISAPGESQTQFKNRLVRIFSNPVTASSLATDLTHDKKFHLKILSSKDPAKVQSKLQQIADYINEVKTVVKDLSIFADDKNYKPIQQRKVTRFYFRNVALKKCSFVYELNPNPQPSFYFTSNPSSGSTDYFGYCEYDITRNSSPGCCRTVPLKNIDDNLTDEFKVYWNTATQNKEGISLPYKFVFSYIKYVSAQPWYKQQKQIRKRFYFCLPKQFMKEWILSLNAKTETKTIDGFLALCTEQPEVVDTKEQEFENRVTELFGLSIPKRKK